MRLIRTIIAAFRFAQWYWSTGADADVIVVDEPEPVKPKHFDWRVPDNAKVNISSDENWGVREHDTRCRIWGAGDWMDRSR